MQPTLYDVELWLDYAAKMRALSWTMTDPSTRQLLLTAAGGFDTIAQLAGALSAGSKPPLVLMLNWATYQSTAERAAQPLTASSRTPATR
jgi:hypothetical protein